MHSRSFGSLAARFSVAPGANGQQKWRTYVYTLNQITIIGFTGSDADVHYRQSGTLVTTLSVATKESRKDADGNWHNRTDWHRVVSFSKLAEYSRTLPKGSYVWCKAQSALASTNEMAQNIASSKFAPIPSVSWIVPSDALTLKPTLTRVIRKRQSGSGSVAAEPAVFC